MLLAACSILLVTEPVGAEASGRVAAPGLRADRATNGEITLTWPGSCLAGDTDFEVYEGTLDDP